MRNTGKWSAINIRTKDSQPFLSRKSWESAAQKLKSQLRRFTPAGMFDGASEVLKVTSEEEINKFLSSYIFQCPLTPGQRHTNLFKLACEACRRGYPQEGVLRGISDELMGSDFSVREIKSMISSGYQKLAPPPSITNPVSPASSQKDIRTKRTDSTSGNDNEAEEAYWQGEEYRKQTPCFPKELYDNLPNLLNECVLT